MFPLVLTILSSLSISLLLKTHEVRKGNRLVLAGSNYIVAATLGVLLTEKMPGGAPLSALWIGIGFLIGIGFVAGFILQMRAIREAGLAITASVARIATLGPVLLSILFYNELPTPLGVAGIVVGLLAFLFIGRDQKRRVRAQPDQARTVHVAGVLLLVLLFLVMTFNDFAMKVTQVEGVDRGALLAMVFGSAGLICWTLVLSGVVRRNSGGQQSAERRERHIQLHDVARGLLLGVPNFFSSWFLIAALEQLSAAVVFPVWSVSGLLLSALAAVLFWRERPGADGWRGIALAAVAVLLLGLG